MATNYNAKKKPELEALLKERGLSHTGNKPDLVSRLQEDDAKKGNTGSAATSATVAAGEDQIDWDDEDTNAANSNLAAAAATDKPANKAALEAGGIGRVSNPVDVPNQVVDEANDPGKTDDLVVSMPAADNTAAAAPTVDDQAKEDAEAKQKINDEKFKADLAASEADKEAEKRKKRAERFGIVQDEDEEEKKKKERAEKFGTGQETEQSFIKMLDGALPERRERKRGRDRNDIGRGGIQKRVDSRRRDNRPRGQGNGNGRAGQKAQTGQNAMSEADRAAAERRAKRFAPAASAS